VYHVFVVMVNFMIFSPSGHDKFDQLTQLILTLNKNVDTIMANNNILNRKLDIQIMSSKH
jgi:hypothetical protein